jgi:hypothetical protein
MIADFQSTMKIIQEKKYDQLDKIAITEGVIFKYFREKISKETTNETTSSLKRQVLLSY